ncbi:MAG: hypothetical protein AABX11_02800 [Nanoarchaeota archaeon]
MNNIELVLLRHEDEYLINIFVLRVIGEGDKIKQKVLYVESNPVGAPQIFPICWMNMNFDSSWNHFYQKDGKVVDYKMTREDAVTHAEKMIRDSAANYIQKRSGEFGKITLVDNLSHPSGGETNFNHRFWYTPVWFPEI